MGQLTVGQKGPLGKPANGADQMALPFSSYRPSTGPYEPLAVGGHGVKHLGHALGLVRLEVSPDRGGGPQ